MVSKGFNGIFMDIILKNTTNSYGLVVKLLHWVMGIMLIGMVIIGFTMPGIEDPVLKSKVYNLHKATGALLLFLVFLRFLWRLMNTKVLLPPDLPRWQKFAATVNINALYALMFIMPISGFAMTILSGRSLDVYGLFTVNSFVQDATLAKVFYAMHVNSAIILVGLVSLHILASIYHYFIRKDNVLSRMWFGSSDLVK